ncbi:4-hydroxy-3-methylbut-2-en-1-yl diphosphate synthase (flavodoxin) [Spirochaetia bacterium]|nr:4-hydroxy-3-methylbut-2-en-1-yl diphosphate synthase (flavodoxin) [Spirochaetia bacterium]
MVIQTMWKDRLSFSDIEGKNGETVVARIEKLKAMGCALLRFAVPDMEAAEVLGKLASMVSMPLVADIHFDYKIALRCLDFPIAKIRINPGNIGKAENVEQVLSKAALKKRPIRIGVNAGSLPQDLRRSIESGEKTLSEAMVAAAERELAIFSEYNFSDVLVSMKASGVADTIEANRLFAETHDTPLHTGVTEAGPLIAGVTRNAIALYQMLSAGIGDTIRVSLSDSMENEVIAGREIVNTLKIQQKGADIQDRAFGGVTLVSCPRCGRNSFDTHAFTARWLERLYTLKKKCVIAVMGCAVNGPEEARHADLGITGVGNKALIFRNGKIVRTIEVEEADAAFQEELDTL